MWLSDNFVFNKQVSDFIALTENKLKLDLPKDIELLLHNYAEQLSKEEKFKVNIQQAFERLLRLALGGKDGND